MKLKLSSVSLSDKFILGTMLIIVFVGVAIGFINTNYFTQRFAEEDGFVENLTAIGLFVAAVIVIIKLWRARGESGFRTFCHVLFALMLIFGAGEEISWGQRIFNIESSEFFLEHNAQGETNLHNMVIGDTKINKLIFGQIFTVMLFLYFWALPFIYTKFSAMQGMVDKFGVPVPHLYQSVVFTFAYMLTMIIPSGRKWELGEMCLAFVLVAIVLNSFNSMGIGKGGSREKTPSA